MWKTNRATQVMLIQNIHFASELETDVALIAYV